VARAASARAFASGLAAVLAALAGCGGDKPSAPLPQAPRSIALSSPAFAAGAAIPGRFTCAGAGESPPLDWSGVPDGAQELALLVEDPDADRFVHWTVLAIPPGDTGAPQGRPPRGGVETENSFGDKGWGGPCPPPGDEPHRYVFTVYALDAPLGLGADAKPDAVRAAIAAHALARGTLTARFGR
jgi:Raf kinase inhibitor-like YbhB/YbcL family protein